MGRWSADHWKTATFGWLAFVLVAFVLGGAFGTKSIDPNTAGPGESGRMDRILDEGFKRPADESVLVQSGSLQATDPAFTAAVDDVVARLSKLDVVQNVRSPLDEGNAAQISQSGRAALVEFEIRGAADEAADKIGPVLDEVDAAQQAHPQLFIGEFGDASSVKAIETAYGDDLGEGRRPLPPGDARHPRPHLRSPRGRRHSARARLDCRLRDLRPRGRLEPRPARWRTRPARSCS